jgi:hypothetical protein
MGLRGTGFQAEPIVIRPAKLTMYNAAFFTDAVMLYFIQNVKSRTHRKTLKC